MTESVRQLLRKETRMYIIDILKEWRGVWGVVYVYVARING